MNELQAFEKHLRENEKSPAAIEKYLRDAHAFLFFAFDHARRNHPLADKQAAHGTAGRFAFADPFGDNIAGTIQSLLQIVNLPAHETFRGSRSGRAPSWRISIAANGSSPFSRATVARVRRLGR